MPLELQNLLSQVAKEKLNLKKDCNEWAWRHNWLDKIFSKKPVNKNKILNNLKVLGQDAILATDILRKGIV